MGGLHSRVRSFVSALRRRSSLESEMESEFRLHMELRAEDLLRAGLTPSEAARQARLEFGSVDRYREEGRATRGLGWVDEARGDVRFAVRALHRSPGFSLAAVLTLSVGIGVTAAAVDVIDQLFFRPLPMHEPERLVELWTRLNPLVTMSFVPEQYVAPLREETRQLTGLTGMKSLTVELGGATSRPSHALFVTPDYFDVLGVAPAAGRAFGEADGPARVAVVSQEVASREVGGADEAVGGSVLVDGQAFTIVGIMPAGFTTRRAGPDRAALWLPLPTLPLLRPGYNSPTMHVIGRLSPGATRRQAEAELSAILQGAQGSSASLRFEGIGLSPLDPVGRHDRERISMAVLLLATAAVLLLLLAAVNVGGLLLARAIARRHEIGVRLALGAGRRRVVRQLLTEAGVLFMAGGVLALVVSQLLTTAVAAVPWPVPLHLEQGLRLPVLAFGFGLALLTGVAASLLPALQATRGAAIPQLSGRADARPEQSRVRSAGVVLQLALSLVLLTGAALFLRALQQAWRTDPGFDPAGVALAPLEPAVGRATPAQLPPLEAVLEAARSVNGVQAAALTSAVPSFAVTTTITVTPTLSGLDLPFATDSYVISPSYFAAMGIPLLAGRDFAETDHSGSERVVIVSRSAAEKLWPAGDAVGRRLGTGAAGLRVIGVAGDVRSGSLHEPPQPALYLPYTQESAASLALLVRTGRSASAVDAVSERVRSAVPAIGGLRFERLTARFDSLLLPQRMGAGLLGAFAVFGLLLSAVGLYGVLAYAVALRLREIGVRIALGARRRDILLQFLRRGAGMATIGIGVGLALSAAAARAAAGLLHGVSATDPLAYAASASVLLCIAIVASLIPARRAASVDPMVTLRSES